MRKLAIKALFGAFSSLSVAAAQAYEEEPLGPFDSFPDRPTTYWAGECSSATKPLDILKEIYQRPDNLKQKNFWGFKALESVEEEYPIIDGYFFPAFSFYVAMRENNWSTHKRVMVRDPYCGSTNLFQAKISEEEVPYAEDLTARFELINKHLENVTKDSEQPEKDKKAQIYGALLRSYRDIPYQNSGLDLDPIKALPQLQHDHNGDCEDFAYARLITAVELGLNPDNLAIFIFMHPNDGGHAALGHFDEDLGEWLIFDGTGRPDGYSMGSALVVSNTQEMKNALKDGGAYLGDAVPYMAVTHKGVVVFDIFEKNEKDGTFNLKSPSQMPYITKNNVIEILNPVPIEKPSFWPPSAEALARIAARNAPPAQPLPQRWPQNRMR